MPLRHSLALSRLSATQHPVSKASKAVISSILASKRLARFHNFFALISPAVVLHSAKAV